MSRRSARSRRRRPPQLPLAQMELGDELGWGDRWARTAGYRCIVGVDEVGRGPLAGPVVAAAVRLPSDLERELVRDGLHDSKKLTAHLREALSSEIRRRADVGVAVVDAPRIDEINILRASLEAMHQAVAVLAERLETVPDCLLVDGRDLIVPSPVPGARQQPLIKGDARAACIAAASVVAKVHRDAIMVELDETHAGYGFAAHKGYPCTEHAEALCRLGPSPVHRRSFRGVGGAAADPDPAQLSLL